MIFFSLKLVRRFHKMRNTEKQTQVQNVNANCVTDQYNILYCITSFMSSSQIAKKKQEHLSPTNAGDSQLGAT